MISQWNGACNQDITLPNWVCWLLYRAGITTPIYPSLILENFAKTNQESYSSVTHSQGVQALVWEAENQRWNPCSAARRGHLNQGFIPNLDVISLMDSVERSVFIAPFLSEFLLLLLKCLDLK